MPPTKTKSSIKHFLSVKPFVAPSAKPSEAAKPISAPAKSSPTTKPPVFFQGGPADTSLQLRVGAGCIFSNYSTLPLVADAASESPSFRVSLTPGFGNGEYTVRFTAFQLPPEDVVVIRGHEGADATASTKAVALAGSNATGLFVAEAVAGSGVELSLYRMSASPPPPTQTARGVPCYGFQVDEILFRAVESAAGEAASAAETPGNESFASEGITEEQVSSPAAESVAIRAPKRSSGDESVCGQDESVEAACAASQAMRNASEGVARITITKDNNLDVAYCTGFLLGCEGHLITNQHCIGSWVDALNTIVEFHAEAPKCGENCTSRAACPGDVVVRSTTLVAVSEELDYALVSLINTSNSANAIQAAAPLLQAVGGYLQFRSTGPVLQEEIYVAQHPLGYGKRIAWTNNGQPGRIDSLTVDACRSGDVGYYVDTQEGSSGSPVVAVRDNSVVGLHHCGGCLNGAIPSEVLIADMQAKGVLPACAVRDA